MQIALRLEGGLGDLLLQNRLIPAIKEKYKNAKIIGYFNTEKRYAEFINKFFPFNYDEFHVYKNTKEVCDLDLGFGKENLGHFLFNTPEEYMKEFKKADKFYNLCIDEMKWLDVDFDLQRYFYFFTKPIDFNIDLGRSFPSNFILTHLYPRPDKDWLGKEYITEAINRFKQIQKVVCITTEEHEEFYSAFKNDKDVVVYPCTLDQSFELSKKCNIFIGMDSGIRYMPYHFSKPVFVFSKFCKDYRSPAPSNSLRWLLFDNHVIPPGFSLDNIERLVKNALNSKACALYPYVIDNINQNFVIR